MWCHPKYSFRFPYKRTRHFKCRLLFHTKSRNIWWFTRIVIQNNLANLVSDVLDVRLIRKMEDTVYFTVYKRSKFGVCKIIYIRWEFACPCLFLTWRETEIWICFPTYISCMEDTMHEIYVIPWNIYYYEIYINAYMHAWNTSFSV